MLVNTLQFVTKELNNFLDRNTTDRKTCVKHYEPAGNTKKRTIHTKQ